MSRRLHLVDASALRRAHDDTRAGTVLHALVSNNAAALCEPVALEVLYAARTAAEYTAMADSLAHWHWLNTTAEATRRATEIQRALADLGRHRVSAQRLLVAATAQVHDAFLIHHHPDYDVIGVASGQPTVWISRDGD